MARPEKKIDWKFVDELLEAGCDGTEIAPYFDMHPNTFYDRIAAQYKMSFTDYQQEKRAQGCAILRHAQFLKAKQGDNSMLIWLGKNRLKQSDSPNEITVTQETISNFNSLMAQISLLQSERKIADINSRAESKS